MSQVAHQARAYPSFLSMKGLRVFLLGMLVHHRVTSSIKFAGTHLYTWVERGTVRVKCLAQEHNTMSPARARTRTTRSGDKRTNHDATIGFCGRRKTGEPGEKQGKNQQHTQPTYNVHLYGTGLESRLGHIGGRQAPSPLHHPCSPGWCNFTADTIMRIEWLTNYFFLLGYVMTEVCSSPSKANDNYKSKLVNILMLEGWTI